MKGSLKRTFILFLVCALTLTSGAFNAALACPEPVPQKYKVTYSYIGEPAGTSAPVDNTEYDGTMGLTLPKPTPVAGYDFLGWQLDSWKNNVKPHQPGYYGVVKANLHFVGKWELKTYCVTYKFEGTVPRGVTRPIDNKHYTVLDTVTMKAPLGRAQGYEFNGWTYKGEPVVGGLFKMVPCNVTFIGTWSKVHTLSYGFTNAPTNATTPPRERHAAGRNVLLAGITQTFEGYKFKGWLDPNDDTATIESITMPDKDIKIIGLWVNTYTVTYEFTCADEGVILPDAPVDPTAHEKGEEVSPMQVTNSPSGGYEFKGWFKEGSDTELMGEGEKITMPDRNIVICGLWEKQSHDEPNPETYPVSFTYADDDNTPPDGIPPVGGDYGGEILLTLPAPDPVIGYEFIEWRLGETPYQPGDNYGEVDQPLTFVGYWHKNATPVPPKPIPFERQNVNYAYTGAVPPGAPAAPELLWYLTPGTVKVMPMPQLEGYVFSGWSTQDADVKDGVFLLSGKNVVFTGFWTAVGPATIGVPKTGDEQAFLLPGALALAGIALIVTALCRRDKKRGR